MQSVTGTIEAIGRAGRSGKYNSISVVKIREHDGQIRTLHWVLLDDALIRTFSVDGAGTFYYQPALWFFGYINYVVGIDNGEIRIADDGIWSKIILGVVWMSAAICALVYIPSAVGGGAVGMVASVVPGIVLFFFGTRSLSHGVGLAKMHRSHEIGSLAWVPDESEPDSLRTLKAKARAGD
jgi:hypothetical protein